MQTSVLIIGGGVFGASAALELRRRGWGVTLLDPGPLPHPKASSTDFSKVVRMDYGADDFYIDLMAVAMPRWEAWNRDWPEPLYHEDGFLLLSPGPMEPGSFEGESHDRLLARGLPLERASSPRFLNKRFPAWNPARYADGYLNPRAGWAESGRVVERLLLLARQAGAELREGKSFARLLESDSRVIGVETADGERLLADLVVMASGAWTPKLLPHLREQMSIVGQPVVFFQPRDPALFRPPNFSCWAADISRTGWYGFPALPDGTLKIGNHGPGWEIDPDAPLEVPDSHIERVREFVRESLPALDGAPVARTRLCLYCDSWDGDFYIDHDPARPGLFIACGGSGHGFKFAPVLGEIIADAVERKPNPWKSRFAWRERGAPRKEDARFVRQRADGV